MFNLINLRILLKVLPLTAGFCLAKLAIHNLGWEPWAFDSLTGALFGAATFVIALVLGGTLNEYRSSEAIPSQIVNSLETIYDSSLMVRSAHPEYAAEPLRDALILVARSIQAWLQEGKDLNSVKQAITDLNPIFAPLGKLGGPAIASRIHNEQAKIRSQVAQMQSSRDYNFLAPAYVLMSIFLIGSVIALLLIGADRFSENITVSGFMFTSFIYLLILIRDLDNPFQYDGKSSIDVDLSPLTQICEDLKRMGS